MGYEFIKIELPDEDDDEDWEEEEEKPVRRDGIHGA